MQFSWSKTASGSRRFRSLNRDPEEQTQKPFAENKELIFRGGSLDLFPSGLCVCRSERSLHNQIRLRSQSEPVLHSKDKANENGLLSVTSHHPLIQKQEVCFPFFVMLHLMLHFGYQDCCNCCTLTIETGN